MIGRALPHRSKRQAFFTTPCRVARARRLKERSRDKCAPQKLPPGAVTFGADCAMPTSRMLSVSVSPDVDFVEASLRCRRPDVAGSGVDRRQRSAGALHSRCVCDRRISADSAEPKKASLPAQPPARPETSSAHPRQPTARSLDELPWRSSVVMPPSGRKACIDRREVARTSICRRGQTFRAYRAASICRRRRSIESRRSSIFRFVVMRVASMICSVQVVRSAKGVFR